MEKPKYKKPNTNRLPACTAVERDAIAAFLQYVGDCTERTLNDHRVLMMQNKAPRIIGQVKHFRAQLGTIRFLQSINDQRKAEDHGKQARSS